MDERWLEAERRKRRELWAALTGPPETLAAGWKDALLTYGSETPDNLACADRLEAGALPEGPGGRREYGLRFKAGGGALSEAAWVLEDAVDLAALHERCPEVAVEDWEALLRFVNLLLNALEQPQLPETPSP